MPFTFGEEPANFGDSSSVQCSVASGDFPIAIEWRRNGQPIHADTDASVSIGMPGKRLSYLNIEAVDGHHAGTYTCSASNLAGGVEHSAHLIVNGI